MHIDFNEIQTWTVDETVEVIRKNLPTDATFEYQHLSEGYFEVTVTLPDRVIVESHVDLKMALLNVFGALWIKAESSDPRWRVRDPRQISPKIKSDVVHKDPEDLDPEAVRAVYRSS